ncbi:hypothetical protein [Nocardia sp. NPDC057668]|uniref:hypothetical protein n=1 Tax=Nocardia sp. NPDC057668 TaxID=3346202 RepID=UPI0036720AEA
MLRRNMIALIVAVIAALAVTGGLLVWDNHRDAAVAAARRDAPPEAGRVVAEMLSYSADTIDRDLAAVDGLTGSFQDEYRRLVTETIAPVAKEKGVSTKARIVSAGVLSAARDRVTLLMFIDQITVSTTVPAPTTSSSRVSVTAELHDGRWLVSGMTPL